MNTIHAHQFIRDDEGNLTLLLDVISFDEAEDPLFMVSTKGNMAYLRRGPGQVHRIADISQDVIKSVREASSIVVMELVGENVTHSYLALSDTIDEDAALAEDSTEH